jgi:hypothetical protein
MWVAPFSAVKSLSAHLVMPWAWYSAGNGKKSNAIWSRCSLPGLARPDRDQLGEMELNRRGVGQEVPDGADDERVHDELTGRRTAGDERAADYASAFAGMVEPLVFCAFHPCAPGPGEVEVIEPHACHVRIDEYERFKTGDWRTWLSAQPLALTGFRVLRDARRAERSA